jgi:Gpi18-like mannosyltransferase
MADSIALTPTAQTPAVSLTRRITLGIVALFVITRLLLVGVGVFSVTRLPMREGDQFTHLLDGGPALDMWYRFDAGFYMTIATYGYSWQNNHQPSDDMAFLPLFPLATRAVMYAIGWQPGTGCAFSPYMSTCASIGGIIVSEIALLIAFFLLYDLTRRKFGEKIALTAVGILSVVPTTIYMSGLYTEGLFLCLCLLTFWLLDRDRFALAVVAAALACITRPNGVALYPVLLWYAWTKTPADNPRLRWLRLLAANAAPAALAGYVLLAGITAGDPLAYFHTYDTTWGREAGTPWQALSAYFNQPVSFIGWYPSWFDLICGIVYLTLAIIVFRQNRIWGIFALLVILVPIASGTFTGMPRYSAGVFPFYILIAQWADRRWRLALVIIIALGLMIMFTARYSTWHWVA